VRVVRHAGGLSQRTLDGIEVARRATQSLDFTAHRRIRQATVEQRHQQRKRPLRLPQHLLGQARRVAGHGDPSRGIAVLVRRTSTDAVDVVRRGAQLHRKPAAVVEHTGKSVGFHHVDQRGHGRKRPGEIVLLLEAHCRQLPQ